jgi:hypothetical protein
MADRYWVGGGGTWNTTNTNNWGTAAPLVFTASSSGGTLTTTGSPALVVGMNVYNATGNSLGTITGGSGNTWTVSQNDVNASQTMTAAFTGASVPTVSDNVIFSQPATYTVTMTGALACLDITVSAGTVTFATGTSPSINIAGSMTLLAGTVWSSTGAITFSSTATGRTVTTNGTTINGAVTFNGTGGGWTLGSALTMGVSVNISVLAGTFSTGNFNVTSISFITNGALTRTVNLGSSTVTLSVNGGGFTATSTGLTFNAGTSQINFTGASPVLSGAGITFYNVAFTGTTAATKTVTGANTYNNLAVTGPSTAGVVTVTFAAQQTINGTLSTTGTAGNRRVFFASATYGISVDLVVNSAPSLTDADFRGLYVRGTSAPISGTRIGNRGECRNITFSTPKTVYWNLAGAQNWSADGWATTSTGSPATANFPLPQDTATFTNAGSVTGTITLNTAIGYVPTVDMSGRTTAMTLGLSSATTVYGNWTNGSGTSLSGSSALTFSGGGTQTITSAGKTFFNGITVDTYGGSVELADALAISASFTLTLTNGTFNTKNFNASAGFLSSSNSNVRTLSLGSATCTFSSILASTITNLTVNAGTSQLNIGGTFQVGGAFTFYNLTLTAATATFTGNHTFTNLTFNAPAATGITAYSIGGTFNVTGTLTCAGATAIRRVFLRSDTIGTQRTLTAASISADDCDFRDITLAGAAAGSSPTRAGDCGGNSGITFPAAKTVYWNLAGTQNWSATGWATSSAGSPAVNNFPLAQDTAIFDNAGAAGTVTTDAGWNIGTFDASNRTSAMTLTSTNNPTIYGDWKFGTGVTSSSTAASISFAKNGTQTITSNGVQFGCPVTVNRPSGTVQLADALSLASNRTLTLTAGTFDAVTYNVTASTIFIGDSSTSAIVRMGTGTWTLTGTSAVWTIFNTASLFVGTANILLSNTSSSGRTFGGNSFYYNKITIGGTTGTSTLTLNSSFTIGELASTKTVAHTIAFPASATVTIGKWSVTGTAGNVVTVSSDNAGQAAILSIAGPANSGIDYLSIRDCTVATTSPGEFYVGANSTNVSNNTRVIFTATPAARTLYWVGGTGNWSDTARWSTSSGGASGAAIPTSLDAVNFNSASNATAYTATIDAGVTLARCASFTMAGPAAGNVTFAGTVGIAYHGNVSFAATGITRTYTGDMQWAGNASYTFTTNGLALQSNCTVIGVGSTWTLGSAISNSIGATYTITYGTFDTSSSGYAITGGQQLNFSTSNVRVIYLNNSTITFNGANSSTIIFDARNLIFNAGTSTIIGSTTVHGILLASGTGGLIFNNVSFTSAAATNIPISGANTFNNLSFTGRTTVGITPVTFSGNQTINGTLTVNAGTASAYRTFLASNAIASTRTLTCGAVSATDADFRDITIAGAAAPASGTRLGDAKGNSGITFPAAKTVYWAVNTANWGATGAGSWSATSGGAAADTEFPLAQDTAYIPFATPTSGSTITVNANYNIGTIEMSNRNGSALVTLATGSTTPAIYGNWINGTGTTISGTGIMTFAGRTTQQITSAGKTWTQPFTINTPGGSVTLQDAFSSSQSSLSALVLSQGTFDASTYNVTLSGAASGVSASGTGTKTIAIGSGTWTLAGGGVTAWNAANLTVTGTGTISLTGASAKTFAGNGVSYSGITLNQGGAGALTITGNNTFKTITNTYSATGATSILLGSDTQTLTDPWTATGAATRVLTLSGTSAGSPATLIYTGAGIAASTVDYLSISNVRAYPLVDEWYAGANSTNGGTLGWYFVAAGGTVYAATILETGTGSDSISAAFGGVTYLGTITELATGSDSVLAQAIFKASLAESGLGTDTISAQSALGSAILESATIADTNLARLIARATLAESATGSDSESASLTAKGTIAESATGTDAEAAALTAKGTISETASGSDTDAASLTVNSSLSDTATATDTDLATLTAQSSISETATGTDAVSARAVFLAAVAESATITDLIDAIKGYFVYILESASASDTVSPRYIANPTISESGTGADSISAKMTAKGTIAETATGTDTDTANLTANSDIAESATGTETVTPQYIAQPTISETATGTEDVSARATFQTNISESALAQEIVQAYFIAAAQISELATGTDAVSALKVLAAAVAEAATATDAVVGRTPLFALIQEAAAAQDSVTAAGSIYRVLLQELATAQDAIAAKATFRSSLTETATGTETNRATFIPRARITETATITDVARAAARFAARILETSAASDSVLVAPSVFNAIAVAAATAIDNVNAPGSIYNVTVPESATLSDSVIGAFLWNLIDDSQSVNWQNVVAAQSVNWSAINSSQTVNWSNVDNSQTTSWTNIQDDQDPDWTDVPTLK